MAAGQRNDVGNGGQIGGQRAKPGEVGRDDEWPVREQATGQNRENRRPQHRIDPRAPFQNELRGRLGAGMRANNHNATDAEKELYAELEAACCNFYGIIQAIYRTYAGICHMKYEN